MPEWENDVELKEELRLLLQKSYTIKEISISLKISFPCYSESVSERNVYR